VQAAKELLRTAKTSDELRQALDKPDIDDSDLKFLCGVFADTPQAAWRLKTLVEP